jgi:hypothetical protein
MDANISYDETGAAVRLSYVKTSNCTSNCTWFDDQVRISVHDQWLHQQSTLSTRDYTYDNAARLTQTQDTLAGQGCTTRIYVYDSNQPGDSNRTSLTTRAPGTGGSCATTGGTTGKHTYDAADRLTDTGVTYDEFGRTQALPAADAGGSNLTSTYYVTDRLHAQTQNGQTIVYNLDPVGRVRERVRSGSSSSDQIDHYADGSDSPAWTSSGSSWTRNIESLDGAVAATQDNNGTITMQFANLHGDIVGTAPNSQTGAPALAQNTDEFGRPNHRRHTPTLRLPRRQTTHYGIAKRHHRHGRARIHPAGRAIRADRPHNWRIRKQLRLRQPRPR